MHLVGYLYEELQYCCSITNFVLVIGTVGFTGIVLMSGHVIFLSLPSIDFLDTEILNFKAS
jgi:hypothetical protein